MCDQLNLNATTAYAQFKDLADELFRDQQNGHQGKKYMFTDKKKIEMDFVTFKCQEGSWSDAERDEYTSFSTSLRCNFQQEVVSKPLEENNITR